MTNQDTKHTCRSCNSVFFATIKPTYCPKCGKDIIYKPKKQTISDPLRNPVNSIAQAFISNAPSNSVNVISEKTGINKRRVQNILDKKEMDSLSLGSLISLFLYARIGITLTWYNKYGEMREIEILKPKRKTKKKGL